MNSNVDNHDDDCAPTYLTQAACNEASNMFLDAVTGKHGWAIGEQVKNICRDGQPLDEQNINALNRISNYAGNNGLDTVAAEMDAYIENR